MVLHSFLNFKMYVCLALTWLRPALPIMSLKSNLSRLSQTHEHSTLKKIVHSMAVLGSPFSWGQKTKGVEYEPTAVREGGLMKRLSNLGCHLKAFGDLSFTSVPKMISITT